MAVSNFADFPFDRVLSFKSYFEKFNFEPTTAEIKLNESFNNYNFESKDYTSLIENSEVFQEHFNTIIPNHISKNELKLISNPFGNEIVFCSQKFVQDYENSSLDEISNYNVNLNSNESYLLACLLIIDKYYGIKFQYEKKVIIEFNSKSNLNTSFLVDLNHEFVEVYPKDETKIPTEEQIFVLLEEINNIELWKEYFPPYSWVIEGFTIITLYENTVENALSNLKSILINNTLKSDAANYEIKKHFRSIFKIDDLKIGITLYDEDEAVIFSPNINLYNIESFILSEQKFSSIKEYEKDVLFMRVFYNKETFIFSKKDEVTSDLENSIIFQDFKKKDYTSFIIFPIIKNSRILGFLELISDEFEAFSKKTIQTINLVLPIIINTIERNSENFQNKLDAIIQNQYTRLHPSVYWKFKRQVVHFLNANTAIEDYEFKDIAFENVYALYGEIDIKSSSKNRLKATQQDISKQLKLLIEIVKEIYKEKNILILEQISFQLENYLNEILNNFEAGLETKIKHYIDDEIHLLINQSFENETIQGEISSYFEAINNDMQTIYEERKKYDESVKILNKKIESHFDKKQLEAQDIFPHYFERYATDGVEHNLYIGQSINPKIKFESLYLHNIRLWQLKTICEAVYNYHKWKSILPFQFELTSLILVFNSPLTIKFIMDEKLFDVDGAYNARYEVVKKRIDKAYIKGTEERLTQPNKLAIVFSSDEEIYEYKKYIEYLIAEELIEDTIEELEIEDLQSVSGLKALRITIKSK